MNSRLAGVGLPAAYCDVAVGWIDLKPARPATRPLRCDRDRAAAAERVEHQTAAARAIFDCVRNQGDRLDSWMHGQFFRPSRAHAVDAGIIPDVAAVAPVLPELEVVDVSCGSRLPDE